MTTDTVPAPQNAQAFFEAVEHRRSYYNITKEAILSDDEIRALVERSVKHTPTSFNMQQSRAVVLTGAAHERLWDVVTEAWNKGVEEEEKRNGFKGQVDHAFRPGYGSILFFEDQAVLDEFSGKMPAYSASFNGPWSENSAGILQYVVWTALEAEGYGASLQHFGGISPAVHQAVIDAFKLPASWKRSTAIMPFGKPSGGPGKPGSTKQFKPLEDRVLVFTE